MEEEPAANIPSSHRIESTRQFPTVVSATVRTRIYTIKSTEVCTYVYMHIEFGSSMVVESKLEWMSSI